MTLLGIFVACIMFAILVRAFVRSYGERPPEHVRIAEDPHDFERWLEVDEVAELLATEPNEVMLLVQRNAIPYFVVPGPNRSNPDAYRFQRDEIDAWVVG